MAATVLNSPRAVQMTVFVVHAFVKMREALLANAVLAREVAALKTRMDFLDASTRKQFEQVFEAIPGLSGPPVKECSHLLPQASVGARFQPTSRLSSPGRSDEMDPVPDILKAIFERGNAMQTYWSFYISLSLALVAFFGSAQRSKQIAIIMTIAFVGFASVNCKALWDRANERSELHRLITGGEAGEVDAKWCSLLAISRPPDPRGVLMFHAGADLGVLAALWLLTLRAREVKQAVTERRRFGPPS